MIGRAVAAVDRVLFQEYRVTAGGLGLFRLFYCAIVGTTFLPSVTGLVGLPDSLIIPPPGPFLLVGTSPSAGVATGLTVAMVTFLLLVAAGIATRVSSVMLSATMLVMLGLTYSYGKIDHARLLPVLIPLVFAGSGWGACWSWRREVDPSEVRTGWSRAIMATMLAGAVWTAGFAKLVGGWLVPGTQAAQGYFLSAYVVRDRGDLAADLAASLDVPVLWEMADIATVVVELALLVLIVRLRWFRLGLMVLLVFHLFTLFVMNISFAPQFVVYLAFAPWSRMDAWLRSRLPRLAEGGTVRVLVVAIALLGAVSAFSGSVTVRVIAAAGGDVPLTIATVMQVALATALVAALRSRTELAPVDA